MKNSKGSAAWPVGAASDGVGGGVPHGAAGRRARARAPAGRRWRVRRRRRAPAGGSRRREGPGRRRRGFRNCPPSGRAAAPRRCRAGPGGLRPGGEVGERFAGDLVAGVAEEFRGVLVPGGDDAAAVDLDDGDPDPVVGERRAPGQAGRARRNGCLPGVRAAPAGTRRACGRRCTPRPSGWPEPSTAAARGRPRGRGATCWPGVLERQLTFRVAVGDLDPHGGVDAQAQHVGGGAGVHHGVGDEFAGEDDGVVDDVGEAPALEGVPDEGAGGGDRTPHRLEGGGCPRGDHSLLVCHSSARACGSVRGRSFGDVPVSSVVLCGRPTVPARARVRPAEGPAVGNRMPGYLPPGTACVPVGGVPSRS